MSQQFMEPISGGSNLTEPRVFDVKLRSSRVLVRLVLCTLGASPHRD